MGGGEEKNTLSMFQLAYYFRLYVLTFLKLHKNSFSGEPSLALGSRGSGSLGTAQPLLLPLRAQYEILALERALVHNSLVCFLKDICSVLCQPHASDC